jgi:hypothetical protein
MKGRDGSDAVIGLIYEAALHFEVPPRLLRRIAGRGRVWCTVALARKSRTVRVLGDLGVGLRRRD